jgi:3',5'-cyclic-AMP phosphodiesterase
MHLLETPTRTLVHLSDTHILPTPDDRLYGSVDTLANLRDVLDRIAAANLRPDAIIVSGDLANGGEEDSYRRLRLVLDAARERFGAPLFVAMGNHDARGPMRVGLLNEPASDEPYDYVGWVDDLRIVVLDSSVPGSAAGDLDAGQLAWLRSVLSETAAEGTLIVLHHPPMFGPVPVINALVLRNPEALADAIRDTDVIGVLAGHAHHPIVGSLAGVPCFAAPATAYTVDPLTAGMMLRGVEGPGFGVVHLYSRAMVASAVALPTTQRELYQHELSEEVVRRWTGLAAVS